MKTKPVFVLNGPTLNLLGKREPHIYGRVTLKDIEKMVKARAKELSLGIDFRQSAREGELIEWILEARDKASGIIINAAAYSHTSIAILDALKAAELPVIEVHLSNIYKREAFRHHSHVSAAADGVIAGFGALGYVMAVDAMAALCASRSETQ